MNKTKDQIQKIIQEFPNIHHSLKISIIRSLVLFTWINYSKEKSNLPSLEFIQKLNPFIQDNSDNKKAVLSPNEWVKMINQN